LGEENQSWLGGLLSQNRKVKFLYSAEKTICRTTNLEVLVTALDLWFWKSHAAHLD